MKISKDSWRVMGTGDGVVYPTTIIYDINIKNFRHLFNEVSKITKLVDSQ